MPPLVRPKVNPRYHVETVQPHVVFLLSDEEEIALDGTLYAALFSLVDGSRSAREIVAALQGQFSTLEVSFGLSRLIESGYLYDALVDGEPYTDFWASLGSRPGDWKATLPEPSVRVVGIGSADTAPLRAALQSSCIPMADDPHAAAITVVVTDDYLNDKVESSNTTALKEGRPWLLTKLVGPTVWLGPIFVPGKTGCWQCLVHRLAGNRAVEAYIRRAKNVHEPLPIARASIPASIQTAANLAALMIGQTLAKIGTVHHGVLTTLDLRGFTTERHHLTRRPQCEACGVPVGDAVARPITLESRAKRYITDGGYRSVLPDETVARYQHHVSPITGIVKTLSAYDTGSDLLNVHKATHRLFSPSEGLQSLRQSLETATAGKGRSVVQSKASALCEALERFSGIFTGNEPRTCGSYRDLADRSVHPYRCLLFSEAQYRHRDEWNRAHSDFAWIPERFDEERIIDWSPVWSLTSQEFRYLPTAFCFYDYDLEPGHSFCAADSNGNASGNNLEEAILQGFMELVERDAVAVWWYNRLRRPAVDLESFDDPYIRALVDEYARRDRELWVLDVTSDFGIPTFAAVSRRTGPAEEVIQGFGSHFDPRIALSRAVTEMNQMLALLIPGRSKPIEDPDLDFWYREATVANQPYLLPDSGSPARSLQDFPEQPSRDLRDDVLRCVDIVTAHGMEMLVLDQTRADVSLNVVKIIVPGMRHFWARFAPGRLYDVPVSLGWLPQPTPEDQLNPIPICS